MKEAFRSFKWKYWLTDSANIGFTNSWFFFHHWYPIPIFNDVIMLSVDQIKVTSLLLIWILDYVLGDIAHKKIL